MFITIHSKLCKYFANIFILVTVLMQCWAWVTEMTCTSLDLHKHEGFWNIKRYLNTSWISQVFLYKCSNEVISSLKKLLSDVLLIWMDFHNLLNGRPVEHEKANSVILSTYVVTETNTGGVSPPSYSTLLKNNASISRQTERYDVYLPLKCGISSTR
jgi:hypothetical protein